MEQDRFHGECAPAVPVPSGNEPGQDDASVVSACHNDPYVDLFASDAALNRTPNDRTMHASPSRTTPCLPEAASQKCASTQNEQIIDSETRPTPLQEFYDDPQFDQVVLTHLDDLSTALPVTTAAQFKAGAFPGFAVKRRHEDETEQ